MFVTRPLLPAFPYLINALQWFKQKVENALGEFSFQNTVLIHRLTEENSHVQEEGTLK